VISFLIIVILNYVFNFILLVTIKKYVNFGRIILAFQTIFIEICHYIKLFWIWSWFLFT